MRRRSGRLSATASHWTGISDERDQREHRNDEQTITQHQRLGFLSSSGTA